MLNNIHFILEKNMLKEFKPMAFKHHLAGRHREDANARSRDTRRNACGGPHPHLIPPA